MTQKLHFISGLPRSGSTLLAGILRQNPRVLAGMSSPLSIIFSAAIGAMSARNELSILMEPRQREDVLRGILGNYYESKSSTPVVFDTSRYWCSRLAALAQLLPESRVICCVRNVARVIDSIERLVQANPLEESKMFFGSAVQQGVAPCLTVYARAEMLMSKGGVVVVPLDALREAYYGLHADRIMFVRYESLALNPAPTMDAIYDFIGEERFAHDFENVEYSVDDFDRPFGMPGLHVVRKRVELQERRMIIPPDLALRFNIEFWSDQRLSRDGVRVV